MATCRHLPVCGVHGSHSEGDAVAAARLQQVGHALPGIWGHVIAGHLGLMCPTHAPWTLAPDHPLPVFGVNLDAEMRWLCGLVKHELGGRHGRVRMHETCYANAMSA